MQKKNAPKLSLVTSTSHTTTSSFKLNLSSYIFHFSLETDFLNCVCDPEVFPLLFAKTKRVIYKLRFLFTAWQRKRKKK